MRRVSFLPFARFAVSAVLAASCAISSADTAQFTLHKMMDTDSNHLAISYLIPKGWTAKDSISWNLQKRLAPLSISTAATSPDSKFIIRWVNRADFGFTHHGNKGDTGTPPPEHPTDSLVDMFKRSHPGVEVEVVDRQETPAISQFKSSPPNKSRALMCSVKLRYTVNGTVMLTKSGFSFDGYEIGRDPQFSTGNWAIGNITSITGPESQFSKAMKLAAVSLSSRQWDPQFYQQYQEIVMMIVKQIQAEGQAYLDAQFKALRQHFHDLSESNMESFKEQMAAKDKSTRNFCDYVLDQSRYTDGHTEFILPSGYNRAATNGTDFLVTDEPRYSAIGDWHELQKVDN